MFVSKKKYLALVGRLSALEEEFEKRGDSSLDLITTREHIRAGHLRIANEIQEYKSRIEDLIRMQTQCLSFLGDVETKFESFLTVLIRNDITTRDEFEDIWDEIKGWRKRAPDETIAQGDFGKIDFTIADKQTGKVVSKEKDFPVRFGSGVLVIEDQMIGKEVGDGKFQFDHVYPENYAQRNLAGKRMTFRVRLHGLKTKLTDRSTTHGETLDDGGVRRAGNGRIGGAAEGPDSGESNAVSAGQ